MSNKNVPIRLMGFQFKLESIFDSWDLSGKICNEILIMYSSSEGALITFKQLRNHFVCATRSEAARIASDHSE